VKLVSKKTGGEQKDRTLLL